MINHYIFEFIFQYPKNKFKNREDHGNLILQLAIGIRSIVHLPK